MTSPRGFTLIESFMALTVLSIGLLGLASLQVVGVRANTFAKKMAQADQLARDLSENTERWAYNDARLTSLQTVLTTSDPAVVARWNLGSATAVPVSSMPEYGEVAGDTNATTSGALGAYTGIVTPVDSNSKPLFNRYWTVYGLDLAGTGTPQGKLIQIIVRWQEPNLGERQITMSTYKPDPAALLN